MATWHHFVYAYRNLLSGLEVNMWDKRRTAPLVYGDLATFVNDTEDGLVKDRIQRIASFFGGMPFTQSSLEVRNRIIKEDFERTPPEIVELLNDFRAYWRDEIRSEFEHYVFSYTRLPYGSGTNNRYHFHSQSISNGMLYVGYSLGSDSCYYQRKIFIYDVSVLTCT